MLFITMCIIFVFAHPTIRKKAYSYFWRAHSLYVLLYALCLVHGLARLTGAPRFWLFFIGPGIIYALDKVSYQPLPKSGNNLINLMCFFDLQFFERPEITAAFIAFQVITFEHYVLTLVLNFLHQFSVSIKGASNNIMIDMIYTPLSFLKVHYILVIL